MLKEVRDEASVSKEEIFGPILPVKIYSTDEELNALIEKIAAPLSIYIFSNYQTNYEIVLK